MADVLRVACVQLNASAVKADNLERAERLVARAAATGADVVVLPERWNAWGSPDVFLAAAEPVEGGETFAAMGAWAKSHGVTLVGGSVTEEGAAGGKCRNTCAVYDPDGELAALYRKIHLFDVDVDGQSFRESETDEPGGEPVMCDPEGWRTGLSICYDLRFPELYRILALEGAELVTIASAFTLFTGKDHWELLVRARAVENQLYVAAANQWGPYGTGRASYGRSMIVDPWGVVLAVAPDEDTVIAADLDRARSGRIRASLPSLANRQPSAYRRLAPV